MSDELDTDAPEQDLTDDLEDDDDFDDEADDDDFDDEDDDDADDDADDDDANKIVGARAIAVAEHVTRQLAEDPDAIEIEVEERRGDIELLVHANPDDMGRLIGRRGRVIQALRQLVRAAGSADGVKANIDVVE